MKINPKFENVGEICRIRRQELGLSCQDLADIADVSQQYISMFEKGKANSLDILMLYIVIGVDIEELKRGYSKDYENIRNNKLN